MTIFFFFFLQESPPAWTQEAYHPLHSKHSLCCSLGGGGGGTPSSPDSHPVSNGEYPHPVPIGGGGREVYPHPVPTGAGYPILTWLGYPSPPPLGLDRMWVSSPIGIRWGYPRQRTWEQALAYPLRDGTWNQWMEVLWDGHGVSLCKQTDTCENSTFLIPSECERKKSTSSL